MADSILDDIYAVHKKKNCAITISFQIKGQKFTQLNSILLISLYPNSLSFFIIHDIPHQFKYPLFSLSMTYLISLNILCPNKPHQFKCKPQAKRNAKQVTKTNLIILIQLPGPFFSQPSHGQHIRYILPHNS
jgi:hypothetical protein